MNATSQPKSRRKLWLTIVLSILGIAVVAFAAFIGFLQWVMAGSVTGDDGVAAGYAQKVETGGEIEAQYQQMGPHEIQTEQVDDYTIVSPVGDGPWPAVVMVNGTGTPASTYLPILEHLASWGFVVVGNEDGSSGKGESTLTALDALSELDPRIDTDKVALFGHSQGGVGAFNAAAQSDLVSAVYVASPASPSIASSNNWPYRVSELDMPVFMMAGDGRQDRMMVSPWDSVQEAFESTTGPGVLARRLGADHPDVLEFGDGYATAWLCWQLQDDEQAAGAFTGDNPEVARNDKWAETSFRN